MIQTIQAIFDGTVFRREEPLALAPNTRVRITVETEEPRQKKGKGRAASFLDVARSLNLEGPPDWSMKVGQ